MDKASNVKWSKAYVAITAVVFVIIVVAVCVCLLSKPADGMKTAIAALLAAATVSVVALVPCNIEVTDDELRIHRLLGAKRIPRSEVAECGQAYPSASLKVCGSGGFCGRIGWYKDPELGPYFSYVLDPANAFYLILKDGKRYMLSCSDPSGILANLNAPR